MLWRFAGAPDPFGLLAIDGPFRESAALMPTSARVSRHSSKKRPPAFPGKVTSDMPSQYPWWTEG